jgi:hypothetical protein
MSSNLVVLLYDRTRYSVFILQLPSIEYCKLGSQLPGLQTNWKFMAKLVTKKMMQGIADRLAMGDSLLTICKDKALPEYRTISRAVSNDDDLYEIYRRGRVLQAEYYADHINDLAVMPLPTGEGVDNRLLNAEVQRRRLEIDTLKWTFARIQPYGLRDKKEDATNVNNGSITLSWNQGEVTVDG